jgi:NAD-dependent SIR2 family protein deacetylase
MKSPTKCYIPNERSMEQKVNKTPQEVKWLARELHERKKIVVIAGAGISVAAGSRNH